MLELTSAEARQLLAEEKVLRCGVFGALRIDERFCPDKVVVIVDVIPWAGTTPVELVLLFVASLALFGRTCIDEVKGCLEDKQRGGNAPAPLAAVDDDLSCPRGVLGTDCEYSLRGGEWCSRDNGAGAADVSCCCCLPCS